MNIWIVSHLGTSCIKQLWTFLYICGGVFISLDKLLGADSLGQTTKHFSKVVVLFYNIGEFSIFHVLTNISYRWFSLTVAILISVWEF